MENLHGFTDGRVVATAGGAGGHVSRETPQLAGGRNQAIAELGVPVQEFGTQHDGECTTPDRWVFRGRVRQGGTMSD